MKKYNHKQIESKWQKEWEKKQPNKASDTSKAPKFYGLIEFPFPSGAGLHIGHIRSNTAMDVVCRKRRMEGYNVLYPIGWDAFGLPTENFAIKTGKQPSVVTKENTNNFRRQLKALGFSFDWSREVNTTDPAYYKWTQWIFLQMYKQGLAYKSRMNINWCPKDKIGLANEEVINGMCERCGTPVEKREKEQWMLAITKYAERLDKDLDSVDYLEKIKIQQRNWIGRSEGAEIDFTIKNSDQKIKVFTTRADTLFGVTYLVLAPEHELVSILKAKNQEEVDRYVKEVKNKSEIDRTANDKEKSGVELKGVKAIHPATKEELPVFIADYVLSGYGTGAVMAVPAHDQRDFQFANKYGLEIKDVIRPFVMDHVNPHKEGAPLVIRKVSHAIVFDPKNNKYLIIRNKKFGWDTVIIGGIEEGEDPIDAALRELKEETGYIDLEFKKTLGNPTEAAYYTKHKGENRVAIATGIYFELRSDQTIDIAEGEDKDNEILWIDPKDFVPGKMVNSELPFWLERIANSEGVAYVGEGVLINSDKYNSLSSTEARKLITTSFGKKIIKYKLRDWVFSRQRYWGEPIPMINCEKCGWVAVPDKDLPVELPKVKNYEPSDNGESPLAAISKWVNTICPECKGPAKRETDTMPNWAGSSWYYLRYADSKNKKVFASKKMLDKWTPVDWYNGGMEHTTLHVLYSRFWHKFLFDQKLVPTSEPYLKRTSHGLVLAEGGEKMSKSKGNVINPDDLIKIYGADSLRVYEMFMGPFDQGVAWSSESIIGSRRFIERIWNLQEKIDKKIKINKDTEILLHQTIKKVGEDIESMAFNTAISSMMILLNKLEKEEKIDKNTYSIFLKLVAPFAPHVAEDLWGQIGGKGSIHKAPWPVFDALKLVADEMTIAVQVGGKVRAEISVSRDEKKEEIIRRAKSDLRVEKWLSGKKIIKEIYVPNRLVNIVVD